MATNNDIKKTLALINNMNQSANVDSKLHSLAKIKANLTNNEANLKIFKQLFGFRHLCKLLNVNSNMKVINLVLSILANGAMKPDICKEIVIEHNVLKDVCAVMFYVEYTSPSIHCRAIRLIANIARTSTYSKYVMKFSFIPKIVSILATTTSSDLIITCIRAIKHVWMWDQLQVGNELVSLNAIKYCLDQLITLPASSPKLVHSHLSIVQAMLGVNTKTFIAQMSYSHYEWIVNQLCCHGNQMDGMLIQMLLTLALRPKAHFELAKTSLVDKIISLVWPFHTANPSTIHHLIHILSLLCKENLFRQKIIESPVAVTALLTYLEVDDVREAMDSGREDHGSGRISADLSTDVSMNEDTGLEVDEIESGGASTSAKPDKSSVNLLTNSIHYHILLCINAYQYDHKGIYMFIRANLIPILMKRLSSQIEKYEYRHNSPVCDQSKYLSTKQSLNRSGNMSPLSPGNMSPTSSSLSPLYLSPNRSPPWSSGAATSSEVGLEMGDAGEEDDDRSVYSPLIEFSDDEVLSNAEENEDSNDVNDGQVNALSSLAGDSQEERLDVHVIRIMLHISYMKYPFEQLSYVNTWSTLVDYLVKIQQDDCCRNVYKILLIICKRREFLRVLLQDSFILVVHRKLCRMKHGPHCMVCSNVMIYGQGIINEISNETNSHYGFSEIMLQYHSHLAFAHSVGQQSSLHQSTIPPHPVGQQSSLHQSTIPSHTPTNILSHTRSSIPPLTPTNIPPHTPSNIQTHIPSNIPSHTPSNIEPHTLNNVPSSNTSPGNNTTGNILSSISSHVSNTPSNIHSSDTPPIISNNAPSTSSNAQSVPSNAHSIPSNTHSIPSNTHSVPSNAHSLPSNTHSVPSNALISGGGLIHFMVPYLLKDHPSFHRILFGSDAILSRILSELDGPNQEEAVSCVEELLSPLGGVGEARRSVLCREKCVATSYEGDITFLLDDGCTVKANRDLLTARSLYFESMLCGNFKETDQTANIRLTNISAACLGVLLKLVAHYCTCALPRDDVQVFLELVVKSDEYLLHELNRKLIDILYAPNALVTASNVHLVYAWSLHYNEFVQACLSNYENFFSKNEYPSMKRMKLSGRGERRDDARFCAGKEDDRSVDKDNQRAAKEDVCREDDGRAVEKDDQQCAGKEDDKTDKMNVNREERRKKTLDNYQIDTNIEPSGERVSQWLIGSEDVSLRNEAKDLHDNGVTTVIKSSDNKALGQMTYQRDSDNCDNNDLDTLEVAERNDKETNNEVVGVKNPTEQAGCSYQFDVEMADVRTNAHGQDNRETRDLKSNAKENISVGVIETDATMSHSKLKDVSQSELNEQEINTTRSKLNEMDVNKHESVGVDEIDETHVGGNDPQVEKKLKDDSKVESGNNARNIMDVNQLSVSCTIEDMDVTDETKDKKNASIADLLTQSEQPCLVSDLINEINQNKKLLSLGGVGSSGSNVHSIIDQGKDEIKNILLLKNETSFKLRKLPLAGKRKSQTGPGRLSLTTAGSPAGRRENLNVHLIKHMFNSRKCVDIVRNIIEISRTSEDSEDYIFDQFKQDLYDLIFETLK